MLMLLENKIFLTLKNLCCEAEEKGGIPKLIELSPQEAIDLLRESVSLRSEHGDISNLLSFTYAEYKKENVVLFNSLKFKLHNSKLGVDTIKEVINAWYLKKIKFRYKYNTIKIPLVIKPKSILINETIKPKPENPDLDT